MTATASRPTNAAPRDRSLADRGEWVLAMRACGVGIGSACSCTITSNQHPDMSPRVARRTTEPVAVVYKRGQVGPRGSAPRTTPLHHIARHGWPSALEAND